MAAPSRPWVPGWALPSESPEGPVADPPKRKAWFSRLRPRAVPSPHAGGAGRGARLSAHPREYGWQSRGARLLGPRRAGHTPPGRQTADGSAPGPTKAPLITVLVPQDPVYVPDSGDKGPLMLPSDRATLMRGETGRGRGREPGAGPMKDRFHGAGTGTWVRPRRGAGQSQPEGPAGTR